MAERLSEPPEWSRLLEEALTMPGRMSAVYNMFYVYSLNNQILLWMQGVTEPVATFNHWKGLGRHVKKGSKAKAILRPITVKLKHDLDDEGNPKQITKFKLVNALFMLSETEGDELPPYEPPTWSEEQALTELSVERVPFTSVDGNTQGYSTGRSLAINPMAGYPLKTLFHELGHIVLGHTSVDRMAEYQAHRGVCEFQAEAVAYLCMNEVTALDHMDVPGSRDYIQRWLNGEKPSDREIKDVFKAVDVILRAGLVAREPAST